LTVAEHSNRDWGGIHFGLAVIEGLGSALFSANWISGLLYIAGLMVSNPRHALVAILGSFWGTLVAILNHDPAELVQNGYYGFNGVLCGVATYVFCGPSLRLPMLGAIGATMLINPFVVIGLLPLGAPFVLATWGMIVLGSLEKLMGMTQKVPGPQPSLPNGHGPAANSLG
jgi:urea transporter